MPFKADYSRRQGPGVNPRGNFCINMRPFIPQVGRSQTATMAVEGRRMHTNMFDDILSSHTKAYTLEKVRTAEMGSIYELTYHVTLQTEIPSRSMLDDIRTRNGNLPVSIGRVTTGVSDL